MKAKMFQAFDMNDLGVILNELTSIYKSPVTNWFNKQLGGFLIKILLGLTTSTFQCRLFNVAAT